MGNQLFQYAFLYAQAGRRGCQAFVNREAPGFELGQFALSGTNRIKLVDGSEYDAMYAEQILAVIQEPGFSYSSRLVEAADGGDYRGYFQSERYFRSCPEEIARQFRPRLHRWVGRQARHLSDWIRAHRPVVAVHVRRGDYLNKPRVHTTLAETDYYERAAYLLDRKLTGSFTFLVFSDDIGWCEANARSLLREAVPIRFAHGQDAFTDLRLQSLCDHHIIANSSFSWWGAWLARNPSQLVVAPAGWFGPEGPQDYGSVYCDTWTVV